MLYFVNPRKRNRKGKGRMAAGRRTTAKQRAAARRNIKKAQAALRRKRGGKKRARRNAPYSGRRSKAVKVKRHSRRKKSPTRRKTTVARKRKRTSPRRRTRRRRSPVRRRRSYRRNPKLPTARGVGRKLRQGVIDAGGVVVGKAATRVVAGFVPLDRTNPIMNFAVQAGSAIVVSVVANNFVSPNMAKMVLAGGLAAPVESFLKGIPVIGPALGDSDPFLPYGDSDPFLPYGAYPEYADGANGMGAYPEEIVVS